MPTQPQDRRKKRKPFEFVIDGETYTMRSPTYGETLDLINAGTDGEAAASIKMMADCMSPEAYEAVKTLDAVDANELFTDWMAAVGGGEAGKSAGSSS